MLADLGDHVVRQLHQVEPVGDHDRVRERIGDRAQVGGGQIDGHVADPSPPRTRLCQQPFGDPRGGAPVDVRQQPGGPGGVDVNWNEQAAKAAKNYLDMMPFSRSGLIEQLSSKAGDGYTKKQAVYGVDKAGL